MKSGMNKARQKARDENRVLVFGNLTRPILDQMLQARGSERNALRHLAQVLREHKMVGGEYACPTSAGSVEIKISPRSELRTALRFRSAPMTYGPDELRNKQLNISWVELPQTVLSATEGRKIGEVVDPSRVHSALQHEIVKRAEQRQGYCVFHLDLKFIQPTEEEYLSLLSD